MLELFMSRVVNTQKNVFYKRKRYFLQHEGDNFDFKMNFQKPQRKHVYDIKSAMGK